MNADLFDLFHSEQHNEIVKHLTYDVLATMNLYERLESLFRW